MRTIPVPSVSSGRPGIPPAVASLSTHKMRMHAQNLFFSYENYLTSTSFSLLDLARLISTHGEWEIGSSSPPPPTDVLEDAWSLLVDLTNEFWIVERRVVRQSYSHFDARVWPPECVVGDALELRF